MDTMAEWFGLKPEFRDFTIESDNHASVLFARTELDDRLSKILRRSFRTGNPPKFVLYGDWGVGKTHTLRHLKWTIEQEVDFRSLVVFVDLPDMLAKSDFSVAHAALLDALGLDAVKVWVGQFQMKHQGDTERLLRELTQSSDIAKAFLTLVTFGEAARYAWDWLRALKLSPAETRVAGLSPAITQSQQMVNILLMLGRLSREIDDQMLIFLVDEAEKLRDVSNRDAVNNLVSALRQLSDPLVREVGLIIAASFRDPEDGPEPLADQNVMTRFGERNYIPLHYLDDAEISNFLRSLLGGWIDEKKGKALAKKHAKEADGEAVGPFPFTSGGFDLFIEQVTRNGGQSTPRDAQKDLSDFLNAAIDEGKHILSSNFVHELIATL